MQPGNRLGPYEIVQPLGAGGMGEVYLAQDTRLGRKVAVKVLPEQFAADPERLARFEQEARAAAALNHPHIAAVFDVGVQGDGEARTHYIVQEYLQGHSLRNVLDRGPLELKRTLALGAEIAEALRAAHRAGIVHRDLKPENVFVTEDGHAKVLDFGLAKLTEIASGPMTSQSMSPTVLGTQAGAIMGTAGYMAPEQVQGLDVDHRADLFAYGCLFWEMVTGQRAFAGKTVPHTLHKILDEEPQEQDSTSRPMPLRLRWLLQRTLVKDREGRAQSAADVLAELRQIAAEVDAGTATMTAEPGASPAAVGRPAGASPALVLALAAIAVALGAAASWLLRPAPPAPPNGPVRFSIEIPAEARSLANRYQQVLAFSPDGQKLAFAAGEPTLLYLRTLGDLEAVALRGTDEPRSPSFSPDGEHIAFWSEDQIRRVEAAGGAAVTVGPLPGQPQGVNWARDGFIYAGTSDGSIVRLPETGGEPEIVVARAEDTPLLLYGPTLLSDGEWLLFTSAASASAWDAAQIVAQSLKTGERRVIVEGGRDGRVVSTGHLLYVKEGVLLARRFDAATLQTVGGAVPLLEGITTSASDVTGAAFYAVADNGNLAYDSESGGTIGALLAWVDRDGRVEALPFASVRFDASIDLSPDGQRVAVEVAEEASNQVWVYDVDRAGGQRLTTEGDNEEPVWSPDGQFVYFDSNREGALDPDIWRRRADLSAPEEPVLKWDGEQIPTSISADGRWLYFDQLGAGEGDIYRLDLSQGGDPEPVVATPAFECCGEISPDGEFLLFESDAGGGQGQQVFVLEVGSGRRWRISTDGGGSSAWSAATGEILYLWSTGLHAATYRVQPEFRADVPRLVTPNPPGSLITQLALDPDGQRWVRRVAPATLTAESSRASIQVVLNWFEVLKARVPVER